MSSLYIFKQNEHVEAPVRWDLMEAGFILVSDGKQSSSQLCPAPGHLVMVTVLVAVWSGHETGILRWPGQLVGVICEGTALPQAFIPSHTAGGLALVHCWNTWSSVKKALSLTVCIPEGCMKVETWWMSRGLTRQLQHLQHQCKRNSQLVSWDTDKLGDGAGQGLMVATAHCGASALSIHACYAFSWTPTLPPLLFRQALTTPRGSFMPPLALAPLPEPKEWRRYWWHTDIPLPGLAQGSPTLVLPKSGRGICSPCSGWWQHRWRAWVAVAERGPLPAGPFITGDGPCGTVT